MELLKIPLYNEPLEKFSSSSQQLLCTPKARDAPRGETCVSPMDILYVISMDQVIIRIFWYIKKDLGAKLCLGDLPRIDILPICFRIF